MNFEEEFKLGLSNIYSQKEISYFLRCIKEDLPDTETYGKDEWQSFVKRLLDHEPIQYVTGIAPFYGYMFDVDAGVLIPRPETEELVHLISSSIKSRKIASPKILEIGSGSGCIPITLNLLHPDAQITSIDVSDDALKIARRNNIKLKTQVDFRNIDFLDEDVWDSLVAQYDIIVSNPPYIPNQEKKLMSTNVLDFEPHLALFVEDFDPLIFYKKIYNYSLQNLTKEGQVYLECNEYNALDVQELFARGFQAEVIKDIQGKDRMVQAILC